MTRQHIEVITSVERRRRWSREEKERLVAAFWRASCEGYSLRDLNKILSQNRNTSCQKEWASTLTLINVLTPRGL